MKQTIDTNNNDIKMSYDVGMSDDMLAQVDLKVDSFTNVDASVLGLCIASKDTGDSSARGYCSEFRGNDQTTVAILDEEQAWGTGSSFSWTTGVWYRTQIARIGTTIYRKTWAVGNPEPADWQETYTESNNLASTSVSLASGLSVSDFDNLIVRKYSADEPTLAAGAENFIDTTAPSVSVTVPTTNSTVSGNAITLTAVSSDNVGVTGVQFKLDTNTNIGSSGAISPYSVTWDSTSVADGTHTIIAVAHDAALNYATSTAITITVHNAVASSPPPKVQSANSSGHPSGGNARNSVSTNSSTVTTSSASITSISALAVGHISLSSGSRGFGVYELQNYLNTHGYPVALSGLGSLDHETLYFGALTTKALAAFQRAHGIAPAIGYFGPITQAYIAAHQ